jgi:major membrane immunogen (membrane-anchored lipoprotein)
MNIFLLFIFYLSYLFGNLIHSEAEVQDKKESLDKIHWMIEHTEASKLNSEFEKMCNTFGLFSDIRQLKDGIYDGSSPSDDYGYCHVVKFEVNNGKVTSVDYDEVHKDGHAKQNDEIYGEEMLRDGTTPALAYPMYESGLLSKQDFSKIDAVSGATYSLYRFRLAILYAINKNQT